MGRPVVALPFSTPAEAAAVSRQAFTLQAETAMTERPAEVLLEALLNAEPGRPLVELPPGFIEQTDLVAAYALQQRHADALCLREGGRTIGIKLGGTTPAMLQALGLDTPFIGPLLSTRAAASPARLRRADFRVCAIEAEIAVRIGKRIDPSSGLPDRDTLLAAIDAVMPAIEVADSRLANFAAMPATAIIADLGYAGAWVYGADCADWRSLDLRNIAVKLVADGATVREGAGHLVLGDPLRALSLAVADLARRGQCLEPGTVVTTGSCTPPWLAAGPAHLCADFGPLGQVTLRLA